MPAMSLLPPNDSIRVKRLPDLPKQPSLLQEEDQFQPQRMARWLNLTVGILEVCTSPRKRYRDFDSGDRLFKSLQFRHRFTLLMPGEIEGAGEIGGEGVSGATH
ncbi:hypothetical protein FVEG_07250 [Fusarium verticillioides 7600]|uniref:Uncharacterized protein n=1 Tax=Gibberella moniliformis (strain M3125 / FGSC 7600) TaxID=334819 RepID=W7MHD1_GIBM7|nr:hypothetical protein FVEG_07250 [Fusarium verticillioides 7600]EWG46989.1 hypothetical protein FVEG_07250 [Fusarium verticillioides 7600]